MQRHSPSSRVLAAIIAPWFAIVMAEPAALHTCSVHSGTAVGATAAAPATASHSLAVHQHSAENPESGHSSPASPHHGGKQCTCLGGCCAASPVSIDRPSFLSWIPAQLQRERPIAPAGESRAAPGDYLLPFANGPPSRA